MAEEVHHAEVEEVVSHQEVEVEVSPVVEAVVSPEGVVVSLLEVVPEVDREVDFPEVDVKIVYFPLKGWIKC